MEKAMAPHSSTVAQKIPWMEEPGRLQSMGSLGVRHDWATSLSLSTLMHWRRKWQPTPVFLPEESHGWRSLVGYTPRGRKESDMTERLHFHFKALPAAHRTKDWAHTTEEPAGCGLAYPPLETGRQGAARAEKGQSQPQRGILYQTASRLCC